MFICYLRILLSEAISTNVVTLCDLDELRMKLSVVWWTNRFLFNPSTHFIYGVVDYKEYVLQGVCERLHFFV